MRATWAMLKDGEDVRYVCDLDEMHETRGSYAYETEAETKAAEDEELAKLRRGEWVVLAVTKERRADCDCPECSGWHTEDTLCGIVIENGEDAVLAYLKEAMG